LDLFDLMGTGVTLGRIINDLGSSAQGILTVTSTIRPPELKCS